MVQELRNRLAGGDGPPRDHDEAIREALHPYPEDLTIATKATSSVEHLEDNLAAAGLQLTDEQFEALSATAD